MLFNFSPKVTKQQGRRRGHRFIVNVTSAVVTIEAVTVIIYSLRKLEGGEIRPGRKHTGPV